MKTKYLFIFLSTQLIIYFGIFGCKDKAKKFEGKWQEKTNRTDTITIYKSGGQFIVGKTSYYYFTGKWPGQYDDKNEKIVVTISDEEGKVYIDIYYNEKDNSIILIGKEYIKIAE